MRHRCNKRDENLDSSHSVAPVPTNGCTTPPNFDLRHSVPGDWISPPEALGNFSHQKPRAFKKQHNFSTKLFFNQHQCVEIKRRSSCEVCLSFF